MTATTLPAVDEAVAKALSMIEAHDYVSFADLSREIPGFTAEGDEIILLSTGNAVLWAVSPFGSEVFKQLEPLVAFHPSSLLIYLIDGEHLRLDKPHQFMPMTLRPLRFADYIGPNGRVMSFADKKKAWTTVTRQLGKAGVAEGKRKARELVASTLGELQ